MNVTKILIGKPFRITDAIFNKVENLCQSDKITNHLQLSFETRAGHILIHDATAIMEDGSKKKTLLIKLRVPFIVSKETGIHTEFYIVDNLFFKNLPEEKRKDSFAVILNEYATATFNNLTVKMTTNTFITV